MREDRWRAKKVSEEDVPWMKKGKEKKSEKKFTVGLFTSVIKNKILGNILLPSDCKGVGS